MKMLECVSLQNIEMVFTHLVVSLILFEPLPKVLLQPTEILHFNVSFIEFSRSELLQRLLIVHETKVTNALKNVFLDPNSLFALNLSSDLSKSCFLGRV